ncbi:MAG: sigma-54-dependent Fis family transcriptional regulator [Myxococcales bacterium]|nr:sigma-54-dependent Fis family transcriptional regulator [Myxococcales bacterium]
MDFATTLLIVDDDRANLSSLQKVFERERIQTICVESAEAALDQIRRNRIDVVLADVMMPGMNGIDLLKATKTLSPESEVILMTAYGTVEIAVQAMKEGAYDFVTKPFKRIQIVKGVRRALEKQNLIVENRTLREELERIRKGSELIGNSAPMKRTLEMVRQVAPSSATVLLQGESGTGKELVARAIHHHSPRSKAPFIAVNCAAIPEGILESELFGYERGAFTGAVARKEGRFKLADGGTLFLDEIGEMSPQLQVKLLRVLQEAAFERLGGTQTLRVDLRIVAASNRDLAQEVRRGRFRDDLFYRLNVIAITLPPLRERADDVPLLCHHFLKRYAQKNNKTIRGISKEAMELLIDYDWPGNVRELENTIERAVVLSKSDVIGPEEIPARFLGGPERVRRLTIDLGTPLAEIEMRVIEETLKMTRNDKRLAAQLLGIATRTIYRKLGTREEDADQSD